MRNTTFIILILTLSNCSNENIDRQENGWVEHNLSGRVKHFTQLIYHADDVLGEIKKGKPFDRGGMPPNVTTVFNKEGFITEVTRFNLDSSNYVRSVLSYGENNLQIERKVFGKDSMLSVIKYKNDDNGNLIESRHYKPNGQLNSVYLNTYDESGYKIEEVVSYQNSDERRTYIFTNDKDGNTIEEKEVRPFKDDYITSFKYDDKGREIQRIGDRRKSIQTFKYNENGDQIESHYKGTTYSFYIKYEYSYDKKGNWVKRITYEDGIPVEIAEQSYTYY